MGYTWDFKKDEEIWINDQYDTVEECLEEARREAKSDEYQTSVYIGECVPYTPEADCTDILDRMQEQAGDMCGEVGGDWKAYEWNSKDELEELNNALTILICDWMKKYGYYPTCSSIKNIREYLI